MAGVAQKDARVPFRTPEFERRIRSRRRKMKRINGIAQIVGRESELSRTGIQRFPAMRISLMNPTLAADAAVDTGGVSAVFEVVRDGLTMTAVRPCGSRGRRLGLRRRL